MNSFCRLFSSLPLLRNRLICNFPAANTRQPYHLTRRLQTAGDEITNPEEDEFEDQLPFSVDPRTVVGDNPEKIEAMKNLMLEIELLNQTSGTMIPKSLTPKEWLILLSTETHEARALLLQSIYVNHQRLEDFERTSAQRRNKGCGYRFPQLPEVKPKLETDTPPTYRLSSTTVFQRIGDQMLNKLRNFRLARSAMFGTDIFIDCSYNEYMTASEKMHCAFQLLYAYSCNREVSEPFNLILCNANREDIVLQKLHDLIPNLYDDSFVTVTEKSFTEFHPKEKFVYLTPDCYEDLETYDYDSYYIIGAYVDEVVNYQMSLAKAKEQGLRMARLPIDKHVNWCQGSKLLPLNQCVNILNDLKDGACWSYAFRHIAPRKQGFRNFDNDIRGKTLKNKNLSRLIYNNMKKEMLYSNKIQLKTVQRVPAEQ